MMASAPSVPASDAALIERIQLGERELFYDLVQPYLHRLYRVVRPLLRLRSSLAADTLRALWLVGPSKVYSGLGADIVMESLRSKSRAVAEDRSANLRYRHFVN